MDVITEAKRQVFLTGRLDFPDRQKLWKAFGKAEYDEEGYAVRTKGLIRRVKLAQACVKRVLPIWDEYRRGDRRPFYILKLIDSYLRNEITKDILLQKIKYEENIGDFKEFCLWLSGGYRFYFSFGLAAVDIVHITLYDDANLYLKKTDNAPADFDDYDIAYDVYTMYDAYIKYNEKESKIEKEKEYWLWYINEAAYLMEESEIEYLLF